MEIKQTKIKNRNLVRQYTDDIETGRVTGYDGKLDIRPAYQCKFVYKDKQRDAVIETIRKDFPLNVIYWTKTGNDTFEVLDGVSRELSQFVSIAMVNFHLNTGTSTISPRKKMMQSLTMNWMFISVKERIVKS